MVIRRLRVIGYKSLRDVEVRFDRGLTVIVGSNASGKSNLFDALGLLSRLALASTLEDAFTSHRGRIIEAFSFSEGGLEELLKKESLRFSIEVDVELSDRSIKEAELEIARRRAGFEEAKASRAARVIEKFVRYSLTIEYRPNEGVLRVFDEELSALKKDGKRRESRSAFISTEGHHVKLRLEGQASRPLEFEKGLPYTILSRPHYAPHYPHIEAFKREISYWRFYYFEPRLMRQDNDLKVVSVPSHYGEDLAAFFETLRTRSSKQFEATKAALRHVLPFIDEVSVEKDQSGVLRLVVSEAKTPFSARVMSEGTLRLLGMLAIIQPHTPTTVVGFEEPENGIHPNRIHTIARILQSTGDRGDIQVIVNTHSPLLASLMPQDALLTCKKGTDGTRFAPMLGDLFDKNEQIEDALAEDPGEMVLHGMIRGEVGV